MSRRELGDVTVTHIEGVHTHPVLMGKFVFDTPIYVHTGLGNIPFEGNTYLGVGDLAGFSGLTESETIVPSPVQVSLSGLNTEFFNEALNAANYNDKVTLLTAFRDDGGNLIDDPEIFYKGTIEKGGVEKGETENSVSFTLQHALAILRQKIGSKFTDEDQQRKFPGDLGFQFVEKQRTLRLTWGAKGTSIGSGSSPSEVDGGTHERR